MALSVKEGKDKDGKEINTGKEVNWGMASKSHTRVECADFVISQRKELYVAKLASDESIKTLIDLDTHLAQVGSDNQWGIKVLNWSKDSVDFLTGSDESALSFVDYIRAGFDGEVSFELEKVLENDVRVTVAPAA